MIMSWDAALEMQYKRKKKTYLLGEHVDEEWWIVLSCQSSKDVI